MKQSRKFRERERSVGDKTWWLVRELREYSFCFCDVGWRCWDRKMSGRCERKDKVFIIRKKERKQKRQGKYPEC